VISKQKLVQFWSRHPDAEQALRAWFEVASAAKWKTPHDIKANFASASFVGHNRVVFNIKGNNYRLVVAVAYVLGAMYITFVGTHQEYDVINVATVEPER
jgi:mRNA interferase HigB